MLNITKLLNNYTNHNKNTNLLTKKQTQNINQNLPIKSTKYTLILTQNNNTTIKITIINKTNTQTTQTPNTFLTNYQQQIYTNPTIKLIITKKINYNITINNTHTNNQYQQKLNHTTYKIIKT